MCSGACPADHPRPARLQWICPSASLDSIPQGTVTIWPMVGPVTSRKSILSRGLVLVETSAWLQVRGLLLLSTRLVATAEARGGGDHGSQGTDLGDPGPRPHGPGLACADSGVSLGTDVSPSEILPVFHWLLSLVLSSEYF